MKQSRENGQKPVFWRQKGKYLDTKIFFRKSGFVTFLDSLETIFMPKIYSKKSSKQEDVVRTHRYLSIQYLLISTDED